MKFNGFSLIELLVVLSILSILMALGVTTYSRYIQKSELQQAQSDLLMLANRLEQYKLFNLNYLGAAGAQTSPENTGLPWVYESYSPSNKPAQERIFNLSISFVSTDGLAYQIKATPFDQAEQSKTPSSVYGVLIYYSDGRRGYDKDQDGNISSAEMCWNC